MENYSVSDKFDWLSNKPSGNKESILIWVSKSGSWLFSFTNPPWDSSVPTAESFSSLKLDEFISLLSSIWVVLKEYQFKNDI